MTEVVIPERELPGDVDDVLASMVEALNLFGEGHLSVTLTVGGTIITGQVIPGKVFFERQIAAWVAAGGAAGEWPASTFSARQEIYARDEWPRGDAPDAELSAPESWPAFVHLDEAVVYQPNTRLNVGLWRGKLAAIDGFSIGQLGEPRPS